MRERSSGSVTTIQCQPWVLLPVGACSAIWMHSLTSSSGTGRLRSRRLRTERVVVSSSSGSRGNNVMPRSFAFQHGGGSPAPTFVSDPADGEPVRLIRYGADQQRPTAGHEHATPGGEGGGVGRRGRDGQDAAEHARRQRLGVGVDGAARRGRAGEL